MNERERDREPEKESMSLGFVAEECKVEPLPFRILQTTGAFLVRTSLLGVGYLNPEP